MKHFLYNAFALKKIMTIIILTFSNYAKTFIVVKSFFHNCLKTTVDPREEENKSAKLVFQNDDSAKLLLLLQ